MKAMDPRGPEYPPLEVGFAEGILFTRACQNPACKFENGGFILREGGALPRMAPCVQCGHDTVWQHIGSVRKATDEP